MAYACVRVINGILEPTFHLSISSKYDIEWSICTSLYYILNIIALFCVSSMGDPYTSIKSSKRITYSHVHPHNFILLEKRDLYVTSCITLLLTQQHMQTIKCAHERLFHTYAYILPLRQRTEFSCEKPERKVSFWICHFKFPQINYYYY